MKTYLLVFILILTPGYCGFIEKSFYINEDRFSVQVEGKELEEMVGMDPRKPETIKISPSAALLLIDKKVEDFKEKFHVDSLFLQRISLSRFFEYDGGEIVWVWEASYSREKGGGNSQTVSFFVTNRGDVLVPLHRPREKSKIRVPKGN